MYYNQVYQIRFLYCIPEWLIDRRHCQSKWQDSSLAIREKINEAIQDMPAVDEIMQLLSGSCMYILTNFIIQDLIIVVSICST